MRPTPFNACLHTPAPFGLSDALFTFPRALTRGDVASSRRRHSRSGSPTVHRDGRLMASDKTSEKKAKKRAKKAEEGGERESQTASKADRRAKTAKKGGGGGKPTHEAEGGASTGTAMVMGKAKRKAMFVEWFRRCLVEDAEGARGDFLKARDYPAVANVIRTHARRASVGGVYDESLKLLDNKGHFLNIVDQCVGPVVANDDDATTAGGTTRTHWDNVKARQRAKFEKAGGVEGVAEKKRAAREAKDKRKQLQKEREDREAKLKELAGCRKEYKRLMDECRLKGACLDWCNVGKCKFEGAEERGGTACQFKHPEEMKGSLVELARKIKAANVGGKKGLKAGEEAEKRRKKKKAKVNAQGDDSDGESGSEGGIDAAIAAWDDDDDSGDEKKKKRGTLSVLPGDDGSDSDSDDEDVPKIIKLERQRQREEERAAKAARAKRKEREEKGRASGKKGAAALRSAGGRGGGDGGRVGGRGGRGGGGAGGRGRSPGKGKGEKRPFPSGGSYTTPNPQKKKKPRHADGRHAKHAAAHAERRQ